MLFKSLESCQSLVDVVHFRAQSTPQRISCIFLQKETENTMTYDELDNAARAIAARLQALGLQPGDRVLLLYAPGLPLIKALFGCFYAGCIAVPIYPPAQEKLIDKAQRIIANSQPRLVLLAAEHVNKFTTLEAHLSLCQIPTLASDSIDIAEGSQWQSPALASTDVALLQYTSGSTMHPKGVMVSHRNLLDNLEKLDTALQINEDSVYFSWLPPHHDMGLMGCILMPIYSGIPTVMMSPFSFLQNPLAWLKNITKYRATISGSPNFAYDYCVKRIKEDKKAGLDLSSWKVAFNGAEPVRADTMERFYAAFKDYGFRKDAFYPCYGLAEATLLVSSGTPGVPYSTVHLAKAAYQENRVQFTSADDPERHTLVGCGQRIQTVKIIDPDTRIPSAPYTIGEIWVHSDSVAQGYWNQAEETALAFHGCVIGDSSGQQYLRTGDLGFVHEGEVYITGRIKDLIILYGKNYYPQDIEYTIMHAPIHSMLGKCAAFVVQEGQDYRLTVMCEVKNRHLAESELAALFTNVVDLVYQTHQLKIDTIVLIPLKTMPHTTSGKIRRNFCRQYWLDKSLDVVAMSNRAATVE